MAQSLWHIIMNKKDARSCINNGGIRQEITEKSLINQTAEKSNHRLSLCSKHGPFNNYFSLNTHDYQSQIFNASTLQNFIIKNTVSPPACCYTKISLEHDYNQDNIL